MWKFIVFIVLLFICGCSGNSGDSGNPSDDNVAPSEISTPADLKAMSQDCAADFILKADIIIDEPWLAVCGAGYTGTFDGGGYTISFNNNITGGLFAKLGTDGSVKNVKIDISSQGSIDGTNVALAADPNDYLYAFGGVAALADTDSGSIENCIVNIDGSITSADYTGGITGYGGNISKSYVIINGSIHRGKYVGGISGYGDSIINCFAVATDNIHADSNGYAGGIAGYGVTLADNIALVNMGKIDDDDNIGNIFGAGGTGSGTGNNHAYRSAYTDDKNGKIFSLLNLFLTEWWRDAGFNDSNWHLEQDKLPLQKVFYDEGMQPDVIWPFIESVSTEVIDVLPGNFDCNNDYDLPTNIVVTAEWTALCKEPDGYNGMFYGDNYTIIFKEDVNGGLLAKIGNQRRIDYLNIAALKNINGSSIDTSSFTYAGAVAGRANGAIVHVSAVIRGNITSLNCSGGLAGTATEIITSSAVTFGDISSGIVGYSGGLAGEASYSIINSFAIVGGNINGTSAAGGLAGASNGTISTSAAIVAGDITGNSSGGLIGVALNGTINQSFAIVSKGIIGEPNPQAGMPSGLAGGLVGDNGGSIGNGALITNNVAIVDINKITGDIAGNIWGRSTNNDNANNYIFTPGGTGYTTPDGQSGQSVSAANLKNTGWWQSVTLFNPDIWYFEDGYAPLPIMLYQRDIPKNTFPDWVRDN